MKQKIKICLIILCFSIFLINRIIANPKTNYDSIINLLNTQITTNDAQLQQFDSLFKELNGQLIIYKAKEDYFAEALTDQSNRFALIITGLLAIAGLFSFTWFRLEKREINKKINSFRAEFQKLKDENDDINERLSKSLGNAFAILASILQKTKDFTSSFVLNLISINEQIKAKQPIDKRTIAIMINRLKEANADLEEIRKLNIVKKLIMDYETQNFETLDSLNTIDDGEIKNLSAKIRINLNDYMKK